MKKYNYTLSALKGIFAVIIMVNHLGLYHYCRGDVNAINYLIVDAFFVISGYLLMGQIDKEENIRISKQLWKQVKRIYPQYIFGIAIVLLLVVLKPIV